MLDLKSVRENPEDLKDALKKRGEDAPVDELLALDDEWRKRKQEGDSFRALKNKIGLEVAELKKRKKDASAKLKELAEIPEKEEIVSERTEELYGRIRGMLLSIPNIPHESVPEGEGEEDNLEVRARGTPQEFSFKPKEHWELGEALGLLDFERGVKMAGHRFCIMRGDLAKLERAVTSFFLDVAVERGYTEHWTPYLVNSETMTGTGQLPKFEEDLYKCERDGLYLIPTAEVTLCNMHAGEILEEKDLPLNYAAFTPCFRREAGAYGKDIRGMMRQHQLDKVELVKYCKPEESYAELEKLLLDAEEVLKRLELPYRVVELCTGELGFAATKTYDVEVWLPSQKKYLEISSCSNCGDYQARRSNTRFRRKGKPEFVHTLNGSGVAVGRTLIAIMENYQKEDGSMTIPKALVSYMSGKKKISAE